ncbi:uncharacterized protein LOC141602361 [Silene latifolia]|uniref:uncharacterized protein LOC141602361 n=1 Tax=Silene latifolia TaxID=37657 RepID=UPI003D77811B
MAASSSSLPSENEKKDHPFQKYEEPGPTGAYEARQVKNSGFYVQVDMPGVPPDGVKLLKYAETQTVTFSGKTKVPEFWTKFDSSERVYGGYVVLDRDPTQIEIEMKVTNGSMRLFFPGSEGTLHFLSGFKQAPNVEDRCEDDSVVYNETGECQSCFSLGDSADSVSPDIAYSHINPFLMQGVEGVYENRVLQGVTDELMYIRVDIPGIGEKQCKAGIITVKKKEDAVLYGGRGKKEHRLDQGGRSYLGTFTLHCGCCKISYMRSYLIHGVFRILIGKRKIPDSPAKTLTNRRRR